MRTLARRNGQAAERHGHYEAQGFQADGFAARVAAGDDQRPFAGTQQNVQRAYRQRGCAPGGAAGSGPVPFRVGIPASAQGQQRMAGLQQADAFLHRGKADAAAVKKAGQAAFGLQHIQLGQQVQSGPGPGHIGVQQVAQIGQHLALFLALLVLELLKAVVDLHQEHGLEITGFAGLGPVVDDALHAALEVGLERQHIAV